MTRPHANSIPHALLLALLLAVPTALASGMPRAAPPQTSAASSPQPMFTDSERTKLNLYLEKVGLDVQISPRVTQLLGLSKPGETMTFRQMVDTDDTDKNKTYCHYFNRSLARPDLFLLIYYDKTHSITHGYLVDKNQHLIRSYVDHWASVDAPIAMNQQEGEAGVASEIRWWAKDMDESPNP